MVSLEDGLAFATNQNNLLLSLKGLTAAEEFIRRDGEHVVGNVRSDVGINAGNDRITYEQNDGLSLSHLFFTTATWRR